MAVFLGLIVAVSYGAGDFFGGLAAKRTPTTSVVVWAQLVGLVVLGALMAVAPSGEATTHDLAIGAAAGACGGIGVFLLFRGLATGRMSVVAPITAVGAAVLPVVWGLASGERPGGLVLVGVVVALTAVVLVASADHGDDGHVDAPGSGVGWAVGAGVAFGALFILFAQASADAGWWPLLTARLAAASVVALGAVAARQAIVPTPESVRLVIACGVLDITANATYLLAVRRGLLALVAVLSSLYPVVTVLLARVVLCERLVRTQVAGLALALVGVVLIATG